MTGLRPYQADLMAGVHEAWRGGVRRVAAVMATGGGKTWLFAHLAAEEHEQGWPTLVLAHRTELIDQAIDKLKRANPTAQIGRMQGPLKQWRHDIVVGSVQTCSRDGALKLIGARRWGLVVVDECFPAGTPIDGRPIESVRPGDVVRTWDESTGTLTVGRVVGTQSRVPLGMVRVTLDDGRSFACTPNHPLRTNFGWIAAGQAHGASVLSFTHDVAAWKMYGMRGRDSATDQASARRIQPQRTDVLFKDVQFGIPRSGVVGDGLAYESEVCFKADDRSQPDGSSGGAREGVGHTQGDAAQATRSGWQRSSGSGASAQIGRDAGVAYGGRRAPEGSSASGALQAGHGASDDEGLRRGRWEVAQHGQAPRGGRAPDSAAGFARVVRIEVLEPGSDGTYGGVCPDGLVYNFEVAGTHTYLVGDERYGVVVHNCHHVAAPSYQAVLRAAGCFRPDGPVMLGVTATLDRSDGLSLGDTFEAVAEPKIGLIDLIKQGYLIRPRGIRVKIRDLDLDSVRKVAGDLNQGQLGAAMHAAMAPQKLVEAWLTHAKGRQTIAFMPTVAVSQEVADAFSAAGHRFEHLSDATPKLKRAAILDAYRRGEVTGLCNVGLFTEGTDLPMTECVILKMTSSSTLYQQMVGRGLRLHDPLECDCPVQPCVFPRKTECVILDPAGVARRHTMATLVSLVGAPLDEGVPDDFLEYEEDEEQIEEEGEPGPAAVVEYEDGDVLGHELFDLFGESSTSWMMTPAGTWFVPVPDGFIYLLHRPGAGWRLCWHAGHPNAAVQAGVIDTYPSAQEAMLAGDAYIAARPLWQADRDAPWRRDRAWGSNRTRGEISDEKALVRATALLDS